MRAVSGIWLLVVCVAVIGCGAASPSAPNVAQPVGQTTSTTTPTTDQAAPSLKGQPAFSLNGHTEHGDTIHIEGRFGPILPPSESDVDQTALQGCLDAADGRELVRRLDIAATITSSLPGEVRIGGFVVQATEENQHAHLLLDYVLNNPDGAACYRDTGEEGSTGLVNLGTLQPGNAGHLTVWVVLPDAITPSNPDPSAKQLAHEEWYIGYPAVSVNGAPANTKGGELSVTQ